MRHRYRTAQWVPHPVDFVFAFFADPVNLPKLFPEWQHARIDEIDLHPAPVRSNAGSSATTAAGRGTSLKLSFRPTRFSPMRTSWVARIEDFHWNERFCDRQVEGPFRYWRHCHRVQEWQSESTGEEGTLIIDTVEYELPVHRFERMANRLIVKPRIESVFRHRQTRTEQLLRELTEPVETPA